METFHRDTIRFDDKCHRVEYFNIKIKNYASPMKYFRKSHNSLLMSVSTCKIERSRIFVISYTYTYTIYIYSFLKEKVLLDNINYFLAFIPSLI